MRTAPIVPKHSWLQDIPWLHDSTVSKQGIPWSVGDTSSHVEWSQRWKMLNGRCLQQPPWCGGCISDDHEEFPATLSDKPRAIWTLLSSSLVTLLHALTPSWDFYFSGSQLLTTRKGLSCSLAWLLRWRMSGWLLPGRPNSGWETPRHWMKSRNSNHSTVIIK